jgi:CobQ-like glutamine amidotransferase family enzyme
VSATLVQLYPDELGVTGDRGNVLAIDARLRLAGVDVDVVQYRRGDVLPASADCVIVGGGPLSAVRTVHGDLLTIASRLRDWADAGVPFFAYGAGAELLGRSITPLDGADIEGAGLFPFAARRVPTRKVGYIVTETSTGALVGFEDNASEWILDAGATPLGTVTTGSGNGDGTEGVLSGSSIATQIGGPVLPLNPALTARLVRVVAARAGVEPATTAATTPLDDYAARAREVIVANASHVFSRI